jgi:hypothetical protein
MTASLMLTKIHTFYRAFTRYHALDTGTAEKLLSVYGQLGVE